MLTSFHLHVAVSVGNGCQNIVKFMGKVVLPLVYSSNVGVLVNLFGRYRYLKFRKYDVTLCFLLYYYVKQIALLL